jgi:hypothetical protein
MYPFHKIIEMGSSMNYSSLIGYIIAILLFRSLLVRIAPTENRELLYTLDANRNDSGSHPVSSRFNREVKLEVLVPAGYTRRMNLGGW